MDDDLLFSKKVDIMTNIDLGRYRVTVKEEIGNLTATVFYCFANAQTAMNKRNYQEAQANASKVVEAITTLRKISPDVQAEEAKAVAHFRHDLLESVGWLDNPQAENMWNYLVKTYNRTYLINKEFVEWFFETYDVISSFSK